MKIDAKQILAASVAISSLLCVNAEERTISVNNPSARHRHEIVEIADFPTVDFILLDQIGKEVQYQITHDGKLIFMADVKPGETAQYMISAGMPTPSRMPVCYGRVFPERLDDLAWENDHAAYRAYGPALQRSGEKAFGYDVWCKSVPYPVLEQRFFDHNHRGISYHSDHGNGMDAYGVGPTLGGGASAILMEGDSIVYPYCWEKAEILDNGPLRFTARLTYPVSNIDGCEVRETRLIAIDTGSWLNRTDITFEGLGADMSPIAGIVVHDSNPRGFHLAENMATYADLTQNPENGNGEIYVALISPDYADSGYIPLPAKEGDAIGHVCIIGERGNKKLSYFWGSGWQKGGVPDFDAWNDIITEFRENLQNPLIITTSNP